MLGKLLSILWGIWLCELCKQMSNCLENFYVFYEVCGFENSVSIFYTAWKTSFYEICGFENYVNKFNAVWKTPIDLWGICFKKYDKFNFTVLCVSYTRKVVELTFLCKKKNQQQNLSSPCHQNQRLISVIMFSPNFFPCSNNEK